jgi:hypothetical protein
MQSAILYDRLERALIALEYALADARSAEQDPRSAEPFGISRSQEALQSAGEEIHEVMMALRAAALRNAAARAQELA